MEYNYFYSDGWEPEYKIYLRIKCESLQQYMDLREEILTDEAVKDTILEAEQEIVYYRLAHGSDVAQVVCDEKKFTVEYLITEGNL